MKIGFVVHFFDFRNDVRKIIGLMSQSHQVVLFAAGRDYEAMRAHIPPGVETRIIDERVASAVNTAREKGFRFFGKLPESRQNYYLMERFKISLLTNPRRRKQAQLLLDLVMKLPKRVSYDQHLDGLTCSGNTPIDDIDAFVCFTNISDDYFFARLLRENKNVWVYVYSWDHPCKQMRYSNRVRYLVWHRGIAEDLVRLQGIDPGRITISGASQFGYVHAFLNEFSRLTAERPYPFRYFYFGCAIGIPALVPREVAVIRQVSAVVWEVDKTVKLVVRPYPVMGDWSYYQEVEKLPNVVMDDQFRSRDLSIGEAHILEKYNKMYHAAAFFHLGTTMGLEACFLPAPSVIIDFREFAGSRAPLSLYNFVHQYQNEKYLLLEDFDNVVKTEEGLRRLVQQALSGSAALAAYNRAAVEMIDLKSFAAFAADLSHLVRGKAAPAASGGVF